MTVDAPIFRQDHTTDVTWMGTAGDTPRSHGGRYIAAPISGKDDGTVGENRTGCVTYDHDTEPGDNTRGLVGDWNAINEHIILILLVYSHQSPQSHPMIHSKLDTIDRP